MSTTATIHTLKRTDAELAMAEHFAAALPALPGGESVRAARRDAMNRFSQAGLPHRRIEEWKYTDLRNTLKVALPPARKGAKVSETDLKNALGPLAAVDCWRLTFVDGYFVPELSPLDGLGDQVRVTSVSRTFADPQLVRAPRLSVDSIVALNQAFATDGALIELPVIDRGTARHVDGAGKSLSRPIMLVFLATAEAAASVTTRSFVEIGDGIAASLIEVHAQIGDGAVQGNTAIEIKVGADAVVDHAKVVASRNSGLHLSHVDLSIGRGAIYRGFQLTQHTAMTRNEGSVRLVGEGGRYDFAGVALGQGGEHLDTSLTITHVAPGCESRELFKTVLDDNARAIFQGKVIVEKDAQKTDGKQMARGLMLSPNAEFDSKPELEIYADDVACGHGSTCMELDPDLVFYCRSRGIPEPEARALLIESFIGEAIDKIDAPDLRTAVSSLAHTWLRQAARERS